MNTKTTKPVRYGDQIELEITSLAFGGDSVGRFQDFALFVPGGLPGERVRVRVTQVKDHYATGEILSILKPSPDRVTPNCGIFEECGGCQWQHLSYPRQLQTKRQFVVDSFKRIGRLDNVTVQPCLPSPSAYAYRNKAMPVLSMRDGHFVTGIYEPRSHHLVPYHNCPIQADGINDLLQKVLQKIERSGLTPYQEKKHEGFLRHLAVRRGMKTGEALLAFVTRTETPEDRVQKPTLLPEDLGEILPRVARELMAEVPGLVGVLQNINPSRTNIVFGPTTRVLAGRDHYFEVIDSLNLKVSLKSFLQVNTTQADILHALVREALGEPKGRKKWGTVLDLYSGIGTLALAVSGNADYIVGVEEIGPAVDDARYNAELNRKDNIDFLEGDVPQILLGLKDKGLTQIDAAILDPPRKGVLPEVLARIAAFHPERLVYVSCDPATLARDLALLAKHGYTADWAQPLDMFPQTYHVETVVRLTRTTPLPPEILD
ncbi:MAG TPA: 23S rRNA (uracil(1939)-C(5))-methyltransferase RlmD, partial [bacterium]|nr:23S rRNA (uracil(1939)-C(5))-methyltransferase RlmD [bacterium]